MSLDDDWGPLPEHALWSQVGRAINRRDLTRSQRAVADPDELAANATALALRDARIALWRDLWEARRNAEARVQVLERENARLRKRLARLTHR